MSSELYYLLVGTILLLATLIRPTIRHRPVTSAIVYLLVGVALSPLVTGVLFIDALKDAVLLERVSELTVIVSLFICGMKLQTNWRNSLWRVPLRLAFLSMTFTVMIIAAVGYYWLGLPLGVGIVLGAVLAPTDPVLASDVQVNHSEDEDRLRFSLTGEAGFNDGTAFPFLYLGLGLLGLHPLGDWSWRWWLQDVFWGVLGGLAIGWILGIGAGHWAERLRARKAAREGTHEFLALGLLALSYGMGVALGAHGFLSAFAAGVAFARTEDDGATDGDKKDDGSDPLGPVMLGFKERVERLLEAVTVILVGTLLATIPWDPSVLWFVPLMLFVVRPLTVLLGCLGADLKRAQKALVAWFGIRGIGSVYYLSYALVHGLPRPYDAHLVGLVYPVLGASIVLHGVTVTPAMRWYLERIQKD